MSEVQPASIEDQFTGYEKEKYAKAKEVLQAEFNVDPSKVKVIGTANIDQAGRDTILNGSGHVSLDTGVLVAANPDHADAFTVVLGERNAFTKLLLLVSQ